MGEMFVQLMPLFLIFAIFYFLLIRPQQKRAKQHKEMVAAIQRGDKILSSGGMRGKVVRVINDNDIDLISKDFLNFQFIKVKNSGHWIHVENPKQFLSLITKFLD